MWPNHDFLEWNECAGFMRWWIGIFTCYLGLAALGMYETNFMALLKFTNAIGTSPLQWISKIQGVKKVIFHYLLTEKVIFKFHIYLQFEFNLNHSVLRKCHIKSGLTFWKHKHKKFFQLCKIAKLITIGYRFSWPAKNLAHWVLNFFTKGFLIFIH